jgi:hypothetical protein
MVQDLGWAKWWTKINLGGSIEETWLLRHHVAQSCHLEVKQSSKVPTSTVTRKLPEPFM